MTEAFAWVYSARDRLVQGGAVIVPESGEERGVALNVVQAGGIAAISFIHRQDGVVEVRQDTSLTGNPYLGGGKPIYEYRSRSEILGEVEQGRERTLLLYDSAHPDRLRYKVVVKHQ